jgi:hypothetical protein
MGYHPEIMAGGVWMTVWEYVLPKSLMIKKGISVNGATLWCLELLSKRIALMFAILKLWMLSRFNWLRYYRYILTTSLIAGQKEYKLVTSNTVSNQSLMQWFCGTCRIFFYGFITIAKQNEPVVWCKGVWVICRRKIISRLSIFC